MAKRAAKGYMRAANVKQQRPSRLDIG